MHMCPTIYYGTMFSLSGVPAGAAALVGQVFSAASCQGVLAEFDKFDACCKGAVVNGELATEGGQC